MDKPSKTIDNAKDIYDKGLNYYNNNNFVDALYWFRQAALVNYPNTFYMLGLMHYDGLGTNIDILKACYFFKRGIELKDSRCYYYLGLIYDDSNFKQNNHYTALTYIHKAILVNDSKALEYLEKLANNNDGYAQNVLGWHYENNDKIGIDYNKAF